jgi:Iap family predicted aminopeptidase
MKIIRVTPREEGRVHLSAHVLHFLNGKTDLILFGTGESVQDSAESVCASSPFSIKPVFIIW